MRTWILFAIPFVVTIAQWVAFFHVDDWPFTFPDFGPD